MEGSSSSVLVMIISSHSELSFEVGMNYVSRVSYYMLQK